MKVFKATPRSQVTIVAWLVDGQRQEQKTRLVCPAGEPIEAIRPGATTLLALAATDVQPPNVDYVLAFELVELQPCS